MRNIETRFTDDFADLVTILSELGKRLPQLEQDLLYLASIPSMISSAAHKCFISGPPGASVENATAFSLVRFFQSPMTERLVLAVEAAWFADSELDAQLPLWRAMVSLAQKMEFHGICVNERSVNTPEVLNEMLIRGNLDGHPVRREQVLLQTPVGGVYSAFSKGPLGTSAFSASCIRIFTLKVRIDFSGVPASFT